jgi:hypothetical protein
MKLFAIFLVLLTSCSALQSQEYDYEKAHASVTLAKAELSSPSPPGPVSKECLNCRDVGWVGDGRVFEPCPLCNDGNKRNLPKPQPARSEPAPIIKSAYTTQGNLRQHMEAEHKIKTARLSESQVRDLHDRLHSFAESKRPGDTKDYVVKVTAPWCQPCKEWDSYERQALVAAGWKVIDVDYDTEFRPMFPEAAGVSVPYFFVVCGSVQSVHVGRMSSQNFNSIVKSLRGSK